MQKGQLYDLRSTHGHMASGVPGAVDGMFALHQKYGTLPMAELIEPSIEISLRGYALTPLAAEILNTKQEEFQTYNRWSTPYHSDQIWEAGDTIRQPDLAKTLKHIQTNGRNGFYDGIVADQIVYLISHADFTKAYGENPFLVITVDIKSSVWLLLQVEELPFSSNYKSN